MLKSNISDVFSHKYTKVKINSYDDLPLEKAIAMHNIVILLKFISNENHNNYFYDMFLEKCLYKSYKNAI